jgi:hypothetical protein
MRWGRIVLAVIGVGVAAGGCTKDTGGAVGSDAGKVAPTSTSTASPTSGPASTSTSTTVRGVTPTTTGPATSTRAPVAVAADGFEVTSGSTTKRYIYSGKVTVSAIKDAFRPQLGDPYKESDEQCEAGKLHWVRWKAVDVYFSGGQLAGWGLPPQAPAPMLKTAGGIGIGSTRPEIERAFPNVTVEESTLGTEWFAAGAAPDTGLSGIFASDKPDARNEAMWSGRTCLAR